jgi:hypothetical protein
MEESEEFLEDGPGDDVITNSSPSTDNARGIRNENRLPSSTFDSTLS